MKKLTLITEASGEIWSAHEAIVINEYLVLRLPFPVRIDR